MRVGGVLTGVVRALSHVSNLSVGLLSIVDSLGNIIRKKKCGFAES